MRFYISARSNSREQIKEIYKKIRERGHIISFSWAERIDIKRPYDKNSKLIIRYVGKVIRVIKNSDVFVMISDEEGTDMYGELASAISFNLIYKKPEIFVLGDKLSRSIFPHHSSVNVRKTIEQILDEIRILEMFS